MREDRGAGFDPIFAGGLLVSAIGFLVALFWRTFQ